MKNYEKESSDGTVFGFESLQNELIRTSDEILRDLKEQVDPFVTQVIPAVPVTPSSHASGSGVNRLVTPRNARPTGFNTLA